MPIAKSQLKKLKVKELKDIMRQHKIRGLSGLKNQLLSRILDNPNCDEICQGLSLPERKKKIFSEKQIINQQRFASIHRKVDTIAENRDIRVEEIVGVAPSVVKKICPKGKAICDCNDKINKIVLKKRKTISRPEGATPTNDLIIIDEDDEDDKTEDRDYKNENEILRNIIELLINKD